MPRSLVGIAFPSSAGPTFLLRGCTNDFIEGGPRIARLTQDSAKPLLGLTRRRGAANDHRYLGLRYVHSFIQYLVGDQRRVDAITETFQNLQPFLLAAVTQQAGNQKPPGNVAGHGVRACEDQDGTARMQAKNVLKDAQLFRGPVFDGLPGMVSTQRLTSYRILGGCAAE